MTFSLQKTIAPNGCTVLPAPRVALNVSVRVCVLHIWRELSLTRPIGGEDDIVVQCFSAANGFLFLRSPASPLLSSSSASGGLQSVALGGLSFSPFTPIGLAVVTQSRISPLFLLVSACFRSQNTTCKSGQGAVSIGKVSKKYREAGNYRYVELHRRATR